MNHDESPHKNTPDDELNRLVSYLILNSIFVSDLGLFHGKMRIMIPFSEESERVDGLQNTIKKRLQSPSQQRGCCYQGKPEGLSTNSNSDANINSEYHSYNCSLLTIEMYNEFSPID